MKSQIENAIARSQSHDEVVHLEIVGDFDAVLTEIYAQIDSDTTEIDYATKNDGSYDIWAFDPDADDSSSLWRINVTLTKSDSEKPEAYHTGYEAANQGEPRSANPYAKGTWDSSEWFAGWDAN
jgi:hypothetical protein